jgi:hypothetical protein
VDLLIETLGATGWSFWPQIETHLHTVHHVPTSASTWRARDLAANWGLVETFTPRGVAVSGRASALLRLTADGRASYRELTGQEADAGEWDRLLPDCGADLTRIYLAVVAGRGLRWLDWQVDPDDPLHFTQGLRQRARLQPCATAADLELNLDLPPARHTFWLYAISADKPTRLRVHGKLAAWVDYTGGLAYTTTPYDLSHGTWWPVAGAALARSRQLALL